MNTTVQTPATPTHARAVRACQPAVQALQALEEVPLSEWPALPCHTSAESIEFHQELVENASAHALLLDRFADELAGEISTAADDEADEPAVVNAGPHAATIERYARLLHSADALHDALRRLPKELDVGLIELMHEAFDGSRDRVLDHATDVAEESGALAVVLRNWRGLVESVMPLPVQEAIQRLQVGNIDQDE